MRRWESIGKRECHCYLYTCKECACKARTAPLRTSIPILSHHNIQLLKRIASQKNPEPADRIFPLSAASDLPNCAISHIRRAAFLKAGVKFERPCPSNRCHSCHKYLSYGHQDQELPMNDAVSRLPARCVISHIDVRYHTPL